MNGVGAVGLAYILSRGHLLCLLDYFRRNVGGNGEEGSATWCLR